MELTYIKRDDIKYAPIPSSVLNLVIDSDSIKNSINTALSMFRDGIPIEDLFNPAPQSIYDATIVRIENCFGFIIEVTDEAFGIKLTSKGREIVDKLGSENLRIQIVFVLKRDPEDISRFIAAKVIKGRVIYNNESNRDKASYPSLLLN
jgi:hypothetical protein